jgi:hypothetical protein
MACTNAGAQVLGLMSQVVAGQRWGLGSTGDEAQFKGGWGPGVTPGNGDGWLDRQMGVLTIKGKPIAVAIATTAHDHATGTRNLTTIARWVASHVDVKHAPRRPACTPGYVGGPRGSRAQRLRNRWMPSAMPRATRSR